MNLRDEQRSSFNDLEIEKTIQEQIQKEYVEYQRRLQQMMQQKFDYEVEEFRNNSLPFFRMDILLLLTLPYLLTMCGFFVYNNNFLTAISCLVSCVIIFFVGKSSYRKYQDPQLTNTILWNFSQSLFDFIDIKIPFEVLNNKDRWIDISTVLGCIVFLICKSNSVIYALVLIMIVISCILAFSMKDIEIIHSRLKILTIFLFLGLIVKSIMIPFIEGVLYMDAMNLLLLIIFTIIKIYTDDLEIYHI